MNQFAKRSERKYEQIVQQLLKLIDEGKLEPGDRLPSERSLAENLQCSRASLREAIRVLESEGLIVSKLGGGRYVQAMDNMISVNYDASRVDTLERSAILYFLEARETIEPQIAALASKRATPEDIVKMENLLDKMEDTLENPNENSEIDSSFHMALAEATQNFVFVSMMEANVKMIAQVRKQTLNTVGRSDQAVLEHQNILKAIKNEDAASASKAVKAHIDYLRNRVLGKES